MALQVNASSFLEASKTANGTGNACAELHPPDYRLGLLSLTLLFLASASVGFNFVFLAILRRTAIFDANVRLLLVNAELGITLAAGCLVLRATFYHAALLTYGYDAMALHSGSCALLECLYVLGVASMMFSLAGIGLERYCATWRCSSAKSSYAHLSKKFAPDIGTLSEGEQVSSAAAVGTKRRRTLIALRRQRSNIVEQQSEGMSTMAKGYAMCSWVVGLLYVVIFYWSSLVLDKTLCYCHLTLVATETVLYAGMASWLAVAASTLLLYCLVLRRNRRHLLDFTINTARHNLQERFLAWHNVTITAMLLPAVITNGVLSAIFFSALMPVYGWYNKDLRHSADSILTLVAIVHILAVSMFLHPILTIRTCEKLRFVASKQYPRLKCLWGSGKTMSGKFSTTSMRGITLAEPTAQTHHASEVASGEHTELAESSVGGVPRKKQSDSIIIDYRIDPDQHRQLVERLWSMKE